MPDGSAVKIICAETARRTEADIGHSEHLKVSPAFLNDCLRHD
jgi:hypothetical protein